MPQKFADLLIEVGTEELPAHGLSSLADRFANKMQEALQKATLNFSELKSFVTNRRLALIVKNLADRQADQIIERRGPALNRAFNEDGTPTQAAIGFANSCGGAIAKLQKLENKDGTWLCYKQKQIGKTVAQLMPAMLNAVLKELTLNRPMRWGSGDVEFIRPVHWIVLLYGKKKLNAEILGLKTTNKTYGHRFLANRQIAIAEASKYESLLIENFVIADFAKRQDEILNQIDRVAKSLNGETFTAIFDEKLLNEVAGLVEWPVALVGKFPKEFLSLPPELLIAVMQKHQRCFAVKDKSGKLGNYFIAISNLVSKDPQRVIAGNERVINARLNDAKFFYDADTKKPLTEFLPSLKDVVFQAGLGTMYDKAFRISKIAKELAANLLDNKKVLEAESIGLLAKADLATDMVNEFPELQGIMGSYYAARTMGGETKAIAEHYLPRFAGDILPESGVGAVLAIADRIDTIVGIIGINKIPTGEKDPFALRRSALGIIRIILAQGFSLNLDWLIYQALENYGALIVNANTKAQSIEFILDRLQSYYSEQKVAIQVFKAVVEVVLQNLDLNDFDKRIKAVGEFQKIPEAEALAAANKRVSNILKKTEIKAEELNVTLLQEDAEKVLAERIIGKEKLVKTFCAEKNYVAALKTLAELKEPVDKFFDKVMVMVEDEKLRNNRLLLLSKLHALLSSVADISLL
jgi:glycyl-tRNA synthetase beta chain